MKEKFKTVRFREDSLDRIRKCNEIIAEYSAQNLVLTLRQLYYQLVSENIITNEEKSYKNLGSLVTDARMAGLMDWAAIEDRVRQPRIPQDFGGLNDLVEAALNAYRLPRWKGQDVYVELWVEKDALAGVLRPIANEYHVTMMVNRGYSSASAMYESANRFMEGAVNEHPQDFRNMVLLYLGDHDPSGEDMVRDVRDRCQIFGADVDVRKIALTTAQVRQYKPPPNPAKITDSRAAAYIEKHGHSSWEVDALPPQVLSRLIRSELDSLVDRTLMNRVIAQEEKDKKFLRAAVQKGLRK